MQFATLVQLSFIERPSAMIFWHGSSGAVHPPSAVMGRVARPRAQHRPGGESDKKLRHHLLGVCRHDGVLGVLAIPNGECLGMAYKPTAWMFAALIFVLG
jgi:hypothetical protein